jgi:hypothetical protein
LSKVVVFFAGRHPLFPLFLKSTQSLLEALLDGLDHIAVAANFFGTWKNALAEGAYLLCTSP